MNSPSIGPEELRKVDEAILNELAEGARTKGFLVDETGYHRNTIWNRLELLEKTNVIECLHDSTALYEVNEDPRDTTNE